MCIRREIPLPERIFIILLIMKQTATLLLLCLLQTFVNGQSLILSVESTPIACGQDGTITIQLSGGTPDYCYRISGNPCIISASDQLTFDSLDAGNYQIIVTDANNMSDTATVIVTGSVTIPEFLIKCCNATNVPADSLCVTIRDPENHSLSDTAFFCGGVPPYVFTATSNGTTVVITSDQTRLPVNCSNWIFRITDACGRSTAHQKECFDFDVVCNDCSAGTATISGTHGTAPFEYYYWDDGISGFVLNQPNPNSGVFTGMPALPAGVSERRFKVVDACNRVDIGQVPCIDASPLPECSTSSISISPITPFVPVTITCNSCTPVQTLISGDGMPVLFSGITGNDTYTLIDACGAEIVKHCQWVDPLLDIQHFCTSVQAHFSTVYQCDGIDPVITNISSGVVYTLSDDNGMVVAMNNSGLFTGLNTSQPYTLTASNACGQTSGQFTLPPPVPGPLYSLATSTHPDAATGACTPGWNISLTNCCAQALSLFGVSVPEMQNSQCCFMNLAPGESYRITSDVYCYDTTFTLPDYEMSIGFTPPNCPNDGCVGISGIRTGADWTAFGIANGGFTIFQNSDYFLLDCDTIMPGCTPVFSQTLCNLIPGSSHTLYMIPATNTCPYDTLAFTVSPVGYTLPDSLQLTQTILCAPGDLGTATATLSGGRPPFVIAELDDLGNLIRIIPGPDSTQVIPIDSITLGLHHYRAIDDCGNSTAIIDHTVISLLDVSIGTTYACDHSIQFDATQLPGAIYTWSHSPDGMLLDSGTDLWQTSITAPLMASSYNLLIQYGACADYTTPFQVPFYPSASVAISPDSLILCEASQQEVLTALSGPGNYLYHWNTMDSTAAIPVTGVGMYAVTATDMYGCTAADSALVSLTDFAYSYQSSGNLCFGNNDGAIAIQAVGGQAPYSYQWDYPAASGNMASGLPVGNYQITISDSHGCADTLSVGFTQPILLDATYTSSTIACFGDSSMVSIQATGGMAPYMGVGAVLLAAGNYTRIVADALGCADTLAFFIDQPPALAVQYTASPILCNGDSALVQLSVSGGTPPYTGNGQSSIPAGNYSFPVTDANGCTISVDTSITQPPLLTINGFDTQDAGCTGESNGSVAVMTQGGVGPYAYLWSTQSDASSIAQLGAGTYTVTVSDNNACSVVGSAVISDFPPLSVYWQKTDAGCYGDTDGAIVLDSVSGGAGGPYTLNQADYQPGMTLDSLGAGIYPMAVADLSGCDTTFEVVIDQSPYFEVSVGADVTINLGEPVNLNASLLGSAMPPLQWKWEPGQGLGCDTCLSTISNPISTTVYSLILVDGNGCHSSDSMTVFVQRNCSVYVPNSFSPNGDGINDQLVVYANSCVSRLQRSMVFDRWGNLIYSRTDLPANDPGAAWDGRYKGNFVNTGVYVWVIEVEYVDGATEILKGDVMIMK